MAKRLSISVGVDFSLNHGAVVGTPWIQSDHHSTPILVMKPSFLYGWGNSHESSEFIFKAFNQESDKSRSPGNLVERGTLLGEETFAAISHYLFTLSNEKIFSELKLNPSSVSILYEWDEKMVYYRNANMASVVATGIVLGSFLTVLSGLRAAGTIRPVKPQILKARWGCVVNAAKEEVYMACRNGTYGTLLDDAPFSTSPDYSKKELVYLSDRLDALLLSIIGGEK